MAAFLLTSQLLLRVTAAPVQNLTALRTDIAPPWVPDPNGRGTWSLLYSCVFTLGLCVWTALHLNVPAWNESEYDKWLRRVKWLFIAVFAPEMAVFTAWHQFYGAKGLCKELNKDLLSSETTPQSTMLREDHGDEASKANVGESLT